MVRAERLDEESEQSVSKVAPPPFAEQDMRIEIMHTPAATELSGGKVAEYWHGVVELTDEVFGSCLITGPHDTEAGARAEIVGMAKVWNAGQQSLGGESRIEVDDAVG